MSSIAAYDQAAMERRYAVPPANTVRPNSVVLSMSGTDRTGLRYGLLVYTAVAFGIGVGFGVWISK